MSLLGSLSWASPLKHKLTEASARDGTRYIFEVGEDIIVATPSWDGKTELPIGFLQAVSIASEWVAERCPGKEVELQGISLNRVYTRGILDKWYYFVHIDLKFNDSVLFHGTHFVVVLLDGTVVEPQVENEIKSGVD